MPETTLPPDREHRLGSHHAYTDAGLDPNPATTHRTAAKRRDRAGWLQKGTVRALGSIDEVAASYKSSQHAEAHA